MKRNLLSISCLLMIMAVLFICCEKKEPATNESSTKKTFKYPASKLWAHRANDTAIAQTKKQVFDGLEVDVMYSAEDNELYIGHDEWDGMYKLTLEEWFAALPEPQKTCYWIDMKNLDTDNAEIIGSKILGITEKFKITDNVMVENTDCAALKIVKEKGLHVILWVYNMYWNDNHIDTATWQKNTKEQIDILEPDALSCEYRMYPLLPESFPEQNIHFWHTPAELNDANAELTRTLCRNKSVKVVLVDYNEPIDY